MMTHDNDGQRAFWNEGPGRNWVAFQPDLDLLHQSVSDLLLAAAEPRQGETVLDIGCGAGALAFELATLVGDRGYVHGVDISQPLLERARARRQEASLSHIEFTEGDAQDMDLDQGIYDLVISRFGVMFFADPVAAFRNLARSLKPGGRLVVAAWTGPEQNPWFRLPQALAEARLGAVPTGDPTAPGPMAFRDGDRVLNLLEDAGFDSVAYAPTDIHLSHPGGLAAVMRLAPVVGPLPRMLRDKGGSDADRDAILAAIAEAFHPFDTPEGIRIPAQVNLITAEMTG